MRKFILAGIIIFAIGFAVYAYFGGISKATVTKTTSKTTYVAGRYYQGPMKGNELGEYYKQTAELVKEKKLVGDFGGIYYNNPEKDTDTIKAFIGVVVKDPKVALPAGYEIRTFEGDQEVLQSFVKAHYMVAPNKLYPALFEYATKNNLKLQTLYLERFAANDSAFVQAPLKK